ncbi:MAG: molybdopterin molybdotransferase [Clostridia bacterium]|nr:molybdopterin molybdotransferase [Clostridia bacterium]
MRPRSAFLNNRPWEEALAEYLQVLGEAGALKPGPPEKIPTAVALGRVTAKPVYALVSSPHYPAAAMDGIAVRAEDTFGVSERSPRLLQLGAEAVVVDTGDPLPEGFNAVIMLEEIEFKDHNQVEISAPAVPWQNVRSIGEDLAAGEMLLPANWRLRPFDLGGILAGGVTEIWVHPRPRVAFIPTGTELVAPKPHPAPGQILEYNSVVIGNLVREWGGEAITLPITPDDYNLLRERLFEAISQADIVIINAGSSAGQEDYAAGLIAEAGRVYTHGVAIRPGKPVILGAVRDKPVLGIPGYPVSAVLAAELFLKPILHLKQGLKPPARPGVKAFLARKLHSPLGREEFVRVRLGRVGGRLVAVPSGRGAGSMMSLVRADGIVRVPRLSEGFLAGQEVGVELLRPLEEVEETLVVSGSHDMVLDVLSDAWRRIHPGRSLSTAAVGSLGGLLALQRGEAHAAGIHLLDEETGEYNVSYIQKYLPGRQLVLVNLVYRQNGLMVAPGNPKGINGLADLAREDVTYVNRQPGSGTRVLLDFHLKRLGIEAQKIRGYGREEFTHLAVAAAVAGGTADAGLGLYAVARAFGLEFIPIATERYDLCFPREVWETPAVQELVRVMRSPEFQKQVEALGGYDLSRCGEVVWST